MSHLVQYFSKVRTHKGVNEAGVVYDVRHGAVPVSQ